MAKRFQTHGAPALIEFSKIAKAPRDLPVARAAEEPVADRVINNDIVLVEASGRMRTGVTGRTG